MKKTLIALTLTVAFITLAALNAQWSTFSPQTASTNLIAGIDAKVNWQTSTAACADRNGTVGKDLCTDTGTGYIYSVTASGSPATWARTSAGANAVQINGAAVPASQACVGTNSSSQIVSATCGTGTTTVTYFTFALNTVYQNTTGVTITPAAAGFCTANVVLQALVGSTSPPTNIVNSNYFQIVSSFNQSIVAPNVPNGFYYKFIEADGNSDCTLNGGTITK